METRRRRALHRRRRVRFFSISLPLSLTLSKADLYSTRSPFSGKRRKAPTRIVLKVHGLEWCLFNRTPAFDEIITRMEEQERREAAKEKKSATAEEKESGGEGGARRRNGWKEDGEGETGMRTSEEEEAEEEKRLKGRTEGEF